MNQQKQKQTRKKSISKLVDCEICGKSVRARGLQRHIKLTHVTEVTKVKAPLTQVKKQLTKVKAAITQVKDQVNQEPQFKQWYVRRTQQSLRLKGEHNNGEPLGDTDYECFTKDE